MPVDTACECDAEVTVCSFQFYVEYIFTSVPYAHGQGEIYYIDEEGNFISYYRDQDACIDLIKKTGNGSYCYKETGALVGCQSLDVTLSTGISALMRWTIPSLVC